jgi:hypothetical protein
MYIVNINVNVKFAVNFGTLNAFEKIYIYVIRLKIISMEEN